MGTYTKYSVDIIQINRDTGEYDKIDEVELYGKIKLSGHGRAWNMDLKDERDIRTFSKGYLYKFYINLYEESDYDEQLIQREVLTPETFGINEQGSYGSYFQLDVMRGGQH